MMFLACIISSTFIVCFISCKAEISGASNIINFTQKCSPGVSEYEVINLQDDGWKKVNGIC